MVDTAFKASVAAGVAEATRWGRVMEEAQRETSIEVLMPVSTPDGMGGGVDSYTVASTFLGRVRVSDRQPQSVNVAGGVRISQLWEVVGPTGLGVNPIARLRANGVTYAVVADDEPRSHSPAAHILCYEV